MSILGLKNTDGKENSKELFHFPTSKNALLIFTRNPELGKCKTRLAATIGDEAALEIYKFLLQHTASITAPLSADKFVYYSEHLRKGDLWDDTLFRKKEQEGGDLGIRMQNASTEIFELGYERVIIVGSDLYDITTTEIEYAFNVLEHNDFVLGPAADGGYYLLGMKRVKTNLFYDKEWGTSTVLKATKQNLLGETVKFLEIKNDVDVYEDIKDIPVFKQFLKNS